MTNSRRQGIAIRRSAKRGVEPTYKTPWGNMYQGDCKDVLNTYPITRRKGKVQLILTSPPFPLNRKKKYGNLTGIQYLDWLTDLAPLFRNYLTANGSIVLELGNAWEQGKPIMSTLPLKSLLAFMEAASLYLCQEFICYNPARLPTPAQWVAVERIRVKDAFTRVWWMSPVERPKANNRNVLTEYSVSMQDLLRKGTYNSGPRPSGHHIGKKSFLSDNGGAIPPNVLVAAHHSNELGLMEVLPISNTKHSDPYQIYCRQNSISPHPARMQPELARFFIEFLTERNDIVLDPFAGSNTTGFAAQELKRRWLSIELDQKYVRTSASRFASCLQWT